MDLNTLSVPELLEVAEEFGTDANEALDAVQIIARLSEDGVTAETVAAFLEGKRAAAADAAAAEAAVEVEVTVKPKGAKGRAVRKPTTGTVVMEVPEEVLLYMERENPTYNVRGYKFTHEHPFALVKAADAEFIVENVEGFSYATPKQAREYYS